MKKSVFLLAAMLVLSVCTGVPAAEYNFSIGTSTLGGSYYIFGTPWAKIISEKMPNCNASVQATNGPASNLQLIESGQMQLGYCSNVVAYEAWNGQGWADGNQYRKFRTLFPTYPSYFEMVSLKKLNVANIRDLTGKRVHMTMPGGTPEVVMKSCMAILDIKPKEEVYLQTQNAIDLMKDGRLDVVLAVMGIPTSMIVDLQTTHDTVIVDMDEKDVDAVVAKNPHYTKGVIPANTYANQPKDVNTFVFWNFGVCDRDLPDDVAYEMVKAVFDNRQEFVNAHATGVYVQPENIVHSVIPLHPGAVKYYKEIGIELPPHLTASE